MWKRIGSIVLASSLMLSLGGSCVSASEAAKEAAAEAANESVAEAANESAAEAANESAAESVNESVDEEANESAAEAVHETADEIPDQDTNPDQECEWNVLLYLCGSDLESGEGIATKNLNGIASALPQEGVNFLIETGGAKEWNPNGELGFEIANDRLQRWTYGEDGFVLVDEVEEAAMSDGRTLTDFIRWAEENYSAKKNMLILWDHGGGSCSGLIYDENYDFTCIPLYELEDALRESETHFDLVLTDTCLMASLEMCQALAPYADYLAASEEILAGDGTDYKNWVQYLYDRPDCSPVQLGKRICDSSQQYYAGKEDPRESRSFTMSLIDLSKTDAVAEAFNRFMHEAAKLVEDPEAFFEYAYQTHYAESYAEDPREENTMFDLFDLSRRAETAGIPKKVTHALQDAIEDAVLYNLRSDNHMHSHGLSVYYPMNNKGYDLDHFARTCKNPEHLAFLDSISIDWAAPAWVYEATDRHPELDRSSYLCVPEAEYTEDGSEAYMTLKSGEDAAVFLSYALYYTDKDSNVTYSLGESGNLIPELDEETGKYRFRLGFDGTWPTMDGKPLCMSVVEETESYILYNVPICFQDDTYQMRVMVNYEKYGIDSTWGDETEEDTDNGTESEAESVQDEKPVLADEPAVEEETALDEEDDHYYELLGVWDGFDAHTGLPGRNVLPLSEMEGMTVGLYDVIYSNVLDKEADQIVNAETTLTKDSAIEEEKLPAGTYLVRFVARDVFNNTHYTDFVPVSWDGETVSFDFE